MKRNVQVNVATHWGRATDDHINISETVSRFTKAGDRLLVVSVSGEVPSDNLLSFSYITLCIFFPKIVFQHILQSQSLYKSFLNHNSWLFMVKHFCSTNVL